jgi:hypothetical protein
MVKPALAGQIVAGGSFLPLLALALLSALTPWLAALVRARRA